MPAPRVYNRHHGDAPPDAIYIGRGSAYGNRFVIGEHGSRDDVIKRFECEQLPDLDVSKLAGKAVPSSKHAKAGRAWTKALEIAASDETRAAGAGFRFAGRPSFSRGNWSPIRPPPRLQCRFSREST